MVPDADDSAELVPAFADRILHPDVDSDLEWHQDVCRSIVVLLRSAKRLCCFRIAFFCPLLPFSSEGAVMSRNAGTDRVAEDHLRRGTASDPGRVAYLQKPSVEVVVVDRPLIRRLGDQVLHGLNRCFRMPVRLRVIWSRHDVSDPPSFQETC